MMSQYYLSLKKNVLVMTSLKIAENNMKNSRNLNEMPLPRTSPMRPSLPEVHRSTEFPTPKFAQDARPW